MSFTTMRTNSVVPAQRDGPLSAPLPRLLPVRLRVLEPQALHPGGQARQQFLSHLVLYTVGHPLGRDVLYRE